jgi:hypothetical protein
VVAEDVSGLFQTLLSAGRRTATVQAQSICQLASLSRNDFQMARRTHTHRHSHRTHTDTGTHAFSSPSCASPSRPGCAVCNARHRVVPAGGACTPVEGDPSLPGAPREPEAHLDRAAAGDKKGALPPSAVLCAADTLHPWFKSMHGPKARHGCVLRVPWAATTGSPRSRQTAHS